MAIEDAAAIGILFSKPYFGGDVTEALDVYQKIRLPRATKVQASAAKAATNINERIGTSEAFRVPLFFETDEVYQDSRVIPTSKATRLQMKRQN